MLTNISLKIASSRCMWMLLLSVLFVYTSSSAQAQSTINLVYNNNIYYQAGYGVYTDSSNSETIQHVVQKKFKYYDKTLINLGINDYNNWIRIDLKSQVTGDDICLEIANPIIDEVEYFKVSEGMVTDSGLLGEVVPFDHRKNNLRSYVIPMNLDSGSSYTYFIRFRSAEQLNAPVFIATKEQLQLKETGNNIIDGIYFGIIIVMVLYNLFIFLSTRDPSYFYYIIYIFTVGVTQAILNGYTFKYIWPNQTVITQYSTITSGALSGVATIFFIRNFLNTKTYSPRFHKLLYVYLALYGVIGIFLVFGQLNWAYELTNFNAGIGSLTLLLTAINIYIKYKSRTALLFTFAWSIFIVSIIVFVLKDVGVIPYSTLSVKGLQIGSAAEVILLSIALADKINILKRDKDRAQAKALSIANENARIIQEQNVMLEHKVIERTKALTETNNNLTVALNELKQAQTQLVESEKMASLGQLTAGIAHEINNPINFVTSNVSPLTRDIEELYKLQQYTEEYAHSKQLNLEPINQYKSTIDYDYLKTEISFLLKGIHEGSSRTAEIVKGLRIFSRVDEDDIKLANINEGLDSTIIIVNNQLNNKITIEKEYDNLPLIDCYPGKLNQVFLNLITNGIYAVKQKFGDHEGGKITISTKLTGDNEVTITISDNGIGMDEATKNKLFEPFFTTKPVGEGTGLGLSIAYNTIKKHKGKISANSKLGEGTTFVLSIPKRQINEQQTQN